MEAVFRMAEKDKALLHAICKLCVWVWNMRLGCNYTPWTSCILSTNVLTRNMAIETMHVSVLGHFMRAFEKKHPQNGMFASVASECWQHAASQWRYTTKRCSTLLIRHQHIAPILRLATFAPPVPFYLLSPARLYERRFRSAKPPKPIPVARLGWRAPSPITHFWWVTVTDLINLIFFWNRYKCQGKNCCFTSLLGHQPLIKNWQNIYI